MVKKLSIRETETYRKYHIPSCNNLMRVKADAVFFNVNNSSEHELKKAEIAWQLRKQGHHFLCEAERNKLDKFGNRRRADLVDLTTGIEYEIETDMSRAVRFFDDDMVEVVPVGWSVHDPKYRELLIKRGVLKNEN